MKKCVKCGARYEDTVVKCPECQLYLIKDTVSDMQSDSGAARARTGRSVRNPDSLVRGRSSVPRQSQAGNGPSVNRPKRGRVEPVGGIGETDASLSGSGNTRGGFRLSGETAQAPASNPTTSNHTSRRRNRGRDLRRILRRGMPALRYIVPAALILTSILFITLHWNVIYRVIQCCVIGGIVGGILLTWLSAIGHHYSPEATLVGVIGGMLLACILNYDLFGVASKLGELIVALGPCIIIIAGIIYLIRSPH